MINRNSYKSLIESVNESTSHGLIKSDKQVIDETDSLWLSRGSAQSKASKKAAAMQGNGNPASKSVAMKTKGEAEVATVSEEFDFVDAILAEGLELYGEENLAIILEHFEQTGELSEELADLISNTLEEAATKQMG